MKLFEKKYPNIKVNIVNPGVTNALVKKLDATIASGSGIPDNAILAYDAMPNYVVRKNLLDLGPLGAKALQSQFTPASWSQVSTGSSVFGMPIDGGPMGLLYRADIFAKYAITVPKTWADFADAARKLKAADPTIKMTNLSPADGAAWAALTAQAGSSPFAVTSPTSIKISLNDPSAVKVADYWQQLLNTKLVGTDPFFTDSWNRALSDGKYAAILGPAWMPFFLSTSAPKTAGLWRAADLPKWNASDSVLTNWGGSANVVLKASKHPEAAAALAEFLSADNDSTLIATNKANLWPTTLAILHSPQFSEEHNAFYGGQQVNKLYAEIASRPANKFTASPFQYTVESLFTDTLGKQIASGGSLTSGLQAWQNATTSYAKQQGYKVTS